MSPRPPPPARDAPDVVVHPPILFAVIYAAAFGLQCLWPLTRLSLPRHWPWQRQWPDGDAVVIEVLGWILVALGTVYVGAAVWALWRARTGIPTYRPATALVTGGIYRLTRNPIYAGAVAGTAGLGLLLDNCWLLVLLVPMIAVLRYGVIAREEAYLEGKFGQAYRDYRARVRRRL